MVVQVEADKERQRKRDTPQQNKDAALRLSWLGRLKAWCGGTRSRRPSQQGALQRRRVLACVELLVGKNRCKRHLTLTIHSVPRQDARLERALRPEHGALRGAGAKVLSGQVPLFRGGRSQAHHCSPGREKGLAGPHACAFALISPDAAGPPRALRPRSPGLPLSGGAVSNPRLRYSLTAWGHRRHNWGQTPIGPWGKTLWATPHAATRPRPQNYSLFQAHSPASLAAPASMAALVRTRPSHSAPHHGLVKLAQLSTAQPVTLLWHSSLRAPRRAVCAVLAQRARRRSPSPRPLPRLSRRRWTRRPHSASSSLTLRPQMVRLS